MNGFPAGTVYGTLLNFRAEWDAWHERMQQPPYAAPPKAPVLYVKTANTWSANGAQVFVPAGVPEVEVGATIAMVMGEGGRVAGYRLMNDLSVPHASFFRPPVKFKCIDGFLGLGEAVQADRDAALFTLQVQINGETRQSVDIAQLMRPAQQLLADVGEFMTLQPGDELMLGCDLGRPLARAGDLIEISAPGLGTLRSTLVGAA